MADQSSHTDVFVSYRRLDVDFVKQFVDALKANNKDVWIDWEDLPPGGAEFTEDIRRGIEGADSFVAILSPGYMESTYCVDLELGYATQLNKKIIPIVYEKFEDYPIPEEIGHINWIYFTPHAGQDNTFDESFPRVIDAIDVDFDYVRSHTRLLQRAREWDGSNRRNSYLLTGDEVTSAESWLAQGASKRPPASVIHHEFIQASRQWENQKVRRNLTIAIFVTVLSIFLAGFAFIQRQAAVEQRSIAEQQRAIAVDERNRAEEQQLLSDSRRLAVQSLMALDNGKVDLSLLLGLEAIQSADTLEAIGSLATIFEDNPYLDTYLYDHQASLTSVAYHPTEPIMVTGAEDGSISIWDMDELYVVESLPATDVEIWDIDFHPDGEEFAVAEADGSIEIFDIDGELLEHIENAHEGVVTSITYSPTGDSFITTSYDNNAILWNVETLEGAILHGEDAETTHTDWIVDADFSPTGDMVALMTWDNTLLIWDVVSQTLAFEPLQLDATTTNFSVSVTWSPDGRFILMGNVLGSIRFVDATSSTLLDFILSRHTDHVREIVYSPDGTSFASVSHDGTIYLWNASNGQTIIDSPIIVHSNQVNGVAFSPDGTQMITVGDDERAVLFDMTRPDLLGDHILTHEDEIYSVLYLESGDILSAGLDGNVYLTDHTTQESEVLFTPNIGRLTAASLSSDERLLALATDTGMVQLWDITTREPLSESFTAHSATIFALKFSPDDMQLASAGDDQKVVIWNTDDLTNDIQSNFELLEGHTDGVFDVAWYPTDPTILASASRDDTVRIWDLDTLETIAILDEHDDDVEAVVFDPTGELLVSGGRDQNIIVREMAPILNNEENIPFDVLGSHQDWVLSLAYSPVDDFLVSGGRDRAILIWDMNRLQSYGESLINHDSWVWSVDVRSDGLEIVSGGRDNRMVVWNSDINDWEVMACYIANREFTDDEWTQYRPEADYRDVCDW